MADQPLQESERHLEGEYRCPACGHGRRIQACAEAIISGMLQPDGEVTQDDVNQTILCESSIECIDHMSSVPLERWFDGHWTRWQRCTWAEGSKRCEDGHEAYYGQRFGYCPACKGAGGFNVPVEEVAHVA